MYYELYLSCHRFSGGRSVPWNGEKHPPPQSNSLRSNQKASKHMDEYNQWCDTEARADTIVGAGLILFGLSVTFVDTNLAITNVIAIISLIVFVVGYIMRIVNNKKHLNHFFVR